MPEPWSKTIRLNFTTTKLRKVGIKRVIENLIENAFKYGSDKITITTAMIDKNRNILCSVRDYGKGIEESQLEKMFTPFAQGDHARGSSGSGLGLAIVKRIVESHGGKIQFTNHPDGGLNASFVLSVHQKRS
jgi:two-component system osmolarity sensor histidine kinase EnvZ